jgi:hypothetical protein
VDLLRGFSNCGGRFLTGVAAAVVFEGLGSGQAF